MNGESIVQLGYVVEDVDAAVQHWTAVHGAGPFFWVDVTVPGGRYRGTVTTVSHRVAMGYLGDLNVELIAQPSATPSVYREVFDSRGPGLHHFMIDTSDYAGTLARYAANGIHAAYEAELEGSGPWAYLDARASDGCFVEVYQMPPGMVTLWAAMRELHRDWNGERPLRAYSELL